MEEDSLSRIVKDVAKIVRLESGLEKRLKDCWNFLSFLEKIEMC